jgi:hypothetical protein
MGVIVGLLTRLLTSRDNPLISSHVVFVVVYLFIYLFIYSVFFFPVNRRESDLKVTAAIAASALGRQFPKIKTSQ